MPRILVSTMAKTVLFGKILNANRLKSFERSLSHYSSNSSKKRNSYIFTNFTILRRTSVPKGEILINWRHLSDKLADKGRGDEKNYFLRLSREQFVKIKERKIKEIIADIRALEVEVREMDRKTSIRAEKVRQNLMVEIKELKAMLEKFKKTL